MTESSSTLAGTEATPTRRSIGQIAALPIIAIFLAALTVPFVANDYWVLISSRGLKRTREAMRLCQSSRLGSITRSQRWISDASTSFSRFALAIQRPTCRQIHAGGSEQIKEIAFNNRASAGKIRAILLRRR